MKNLPPEYYQDLEEIQAIDFALVELTLYLDTHPNDQQAMQQFNEYAQQAMQLKRNFETKYGPLQQYGNSYTDGNWSWGTSPWPWQI
ncbi:MULTISPECIES: spore coat protein CotJB [Priestia]|jgi:spore coat protein JB|uniref:CotJB protein n=3 Tax=Priestia TaxID=2800373 RepID=D5DYE5_PRIM1|nr:MULTISPECIES: spore coat protein CotJB [Priestia]AVX09223.1 spore coat protein CotJB [Bacillus sp. Y-01]KOP75355.1 spore coat protein CotJB [Bacillus sp. FJAT-21351]KQU16710.1 spore coat protein CotJB [Bacillus sp. Leaf75]KRF56652.1 spore coat protein CotJB [Bacillus sp. Soil531]MBZ5481649.1 spore coat protein CotJB [Bacillus sp. T_4]MCF6797144.1 spore coat protein CotJB [Bacillus sp. ET1]MCJ7985505.1 spore coat protein CotJB [Priestia sp. OVL9]MDH6653758.1 spore coat protein JB [Bacillu